MVMEVILSNDEKTVRELVAKGYCPVECSINGHSIVDDLVMDHHEDRSHLEAVSIRAIRDHAGAREHDPRFVVVGACDADASFAIAALSGLIPLNAATVTLGKTIGLMDTDPIGRDLFSLPYGGFMSVWDADNRKTNRTQQGAVDAVMNWKNLCENLDNPPHELQQRLTAAKEREAKNVEIAKQDLANATIKGGVCLIHHSEVFGFHTWHGRVEGQPSDKAAGWVNPVVLIYNRDNKNMGLSCPNKGVAEDVFGPGGLKNVFPKLGAWGGRESIGGSPRGMAMTPEDAMAALEKIGEILAEKKLSAPKPAAKTGGLKP
jgi:hypothetical protein